MVQSMVINLSCSLYIPLHWFVFDIQKSIISNGKKAPNLFFSNFIPCNCALFSYIRHSWHRSLIYQSLFKTNVEIPSRTLHRSIKLHKICRKWWYFKSGPTAKDLPSRSWNKWPIQWYSPYIDFYDNCLLKCWFCLKSKAIRIQITRE